MLHFGSIESRSCLSGVSRMLGVNWNRASAQAVQALHVLTREARQVEMRISTGLKVADPRDNGAVYAIAMG